MMAMRIKSKVHTVIFSIILIVLENFGLGTTFSVAAQQQQQQQQQQLQQTKDQNFYFQSPQRFQSPFPASRNGFFPSNGLPNIVQNLPQSLPRSQLGGGLQQPQQQIQLQQQPIQQQQQSQQPQQDQSSFFAPTKNDGSSSDYFQYSGFPQQAARQQENFFQISPRPFAIQPNGNHGVQFVRPPIVPQSQQFTADQNSNPFPFLQPFQQRPPILHSDGLEQSQPSALQQQQQQQQQPILHQNPSVGRTPAFTIYDATKFVKQGQASRLLNDATANRNSNSNNSIRNNVRKSNESVTSQENSYNSNENNRFPNTRNRFHPLSTTKQPATFTAAAAAPTPTTTTTKTTTTTPTTTSTTHRPTSQHTTPAPSIATNDPNPATTLVDQRQNRIPISSRFGTSREQNTSVRINKFLRQPLYTSRENSQQTLKRVNVTHNGSTNRDAPTTSQEVSNRTHQLQLLQQQRQKIRDSSAEILKVPNQAVLPKSSQKTIVEQRPSVETDDDDDEFFYEDEEFDDENARQIEIKTTPKPKEENKPVILTSNFFLPGKPIPKLHSNDFETHEPNDLSSDIGETSDQNKDNAEDVIDLPEEETERIVEKTTKKIVEQPRTPQPPVVQPSTLPRNQQIKPVSEKPVEYEYEYVDEYDEDAPTTTEAKNIPKPTEAKYIPAIQEEESTTFVESDEPQQSTYEAQEPEVTAKPEIKTEKSISSAEQIETSVGPVETSSSASATEMTENAVDTTEGYVVVASVQTSRSISGARYLTFPTNEEEEKRQLLGDSAKDEKRHKDEDYHNESNSDDKADDLVKSEPAVTISAKEVDSTEASVEKQEQAKNESDEAVPETLKTKVHKLSSISEKLAHLHESLEPKPEVTTKPVPVVIRKFSPRTTTKTPRKLTSAPKKPQFNIDPELASLLPPGFKLRANTLSESSTPIFKTFTTPTTTESSASNEEDAPLENIGKQIQFKEISFGSLESLLPKGYKPPPSESKPKAENATTAVTNSNASLDVFAKIDFKDSIDALLPKDYKPTTASAAAAVTTKAPFRLSTVTEDISKFLPPGFKVPKESASTKRPLPKTTMDDISKFLPPGFKLPKTTTQATPAAAAADTGSSSIENVLNNISFKGDISRLLPPGFKSNAPSNDSASKETVDSDEKPSSSSNGSGASANSGSKFVFPKGIGKRPGVRLTTPKPSHAEGPTQPGITIRKGLPTRATTEFTGWPTVSTTPLSAEKIFEQHGAQAIDISEILGRTSSSTSTTVVTTTTTSTTTVRPTQPGLCHVQCDLAGTIKIVDGVKWKPELLDHNTLEWKNLAKEVETQLNNVYSKSDRLKKWYKKIRIDSFSQGSVLVDYFVELADVSRDINTLEIKQMFHQALTEVPMTIVPMKNNTNDTPSTMERIIADYPEHARPAHSNYLMGNFILDPLSTDFIVIPKSHAPPTQPGEIEQNSLIPQWAIAVIVIGAGSLLFVVIFGAAVLMNRQKRSKKKAPVPLTADMLNELNKNHMGGFENYGREELYIEDTWDDVKPDFKPKRFANSSSDRDERFDSWRTQQKYQANADYFYDQKMSKPHYSQKSTAYPYAAQNDPYMENFHPQYHPSYSTHQHHPTHQNAMGLYTYNSRRYNRDYDPDF